MAKKKEMEKEKEKLEDVEVHALASSVPDWEVAGLMRAAGWAPGKQVTKTVFNDTLEKFRNRPQGGGRIA